MIVTVEHHGAEAEPVVIIDDFALTPERLIEDAGCLTLRPMGEHYPGQRASVPPALLAPLLRALAPLITAHFGAASAAVEDAFYSVVTTAPADLQPIQRLPHFDGVETERLALLHFLSRDDSSGTAFYRHRGTGFETITAARLPAYRTALAADIARHGLPAAGYIAGDTPIFERIARHQGRFNRAILYRGNTLHCADIPPGLALPADPASGRFTVNSFLRARA